MLKRREFLTLSLAAAAAQSVNRAEATDDGPARLVLVHGRSQQGKDPGQLRATWLEALRRGAGTQGMALPDNLDVAFPFYGDVLDDFARRFKIPLSADIQSKGSTPNDEFLRFQADFAETVRQRAGITDEQIEREYGAQTRPKGVQNWEWVQAIIRTIDNYGGGTSQSAIETFLRDVFLYTTRIGVRDEIDRIVAGALDSRPAVVVGHSLGSVVAYNILRTDRRDLQVRDFVTIGSPLGIRAIRDQFRPLRFPSNVTAWFNAFDDRDVVALFPLDQENFPVSPAIQNHGAVKNHTDNRHGIVGYLDDPKVARRIVQSLTA